MTPYSTSSYGNSHAGHRLGREANDAIEQARGDVAALLGASAGEVVFTSCGTESNAIVLRGFPFNHRPHVVTTAVEHPSVLDLLQWLQSSGHIELSVLDIDGDGRIDLDEADTAIGHRTALVCVMHAQNETGVIHDIRALAGIARARGARLLVDAVQSTGKIAVKVDELGADFLSLSGHKFHAPKGIGALYIRSGLELDPLWRGAGHERGIRSGTQPTPLIAGLGCAARLAEAGIGAAPRIAALRDRLAARISASAGDTLVLSEKAPRLPNTLAIAFAGLSADLLVAKLDEAGVCASAGAACHSGKTEPTRVVRAMQLPERYATGMLRFSLSRYTTGEEIDSAADVVIGAARALRSDHAASTLTA
jgi:cysteine desulfurase